MRLPLCCVFHTSEICDLSAWQPRAECLQLSREFSVIIPPSSLKDAVFVSPTLQKLPQGTGKIQLRGEGENTGDSKLPFKSPQLCSGEYTFWRAMQVSTWRGQHSTLFFSKGQRNKGEVIANSVEGISGEGDWRRKPSPVSDVCVWGRTSFFPCRFFWVF